MSWIDRMEQTFKAAGTVLGGIAERAEASAKAPASAPQVPAAEGGETCDRVKRDGWRCGLHANHDGPCQLEEIVPE